MSSGTLLEWANSIRYTMANDHGRQFFQDQIQTHGFLFLDDYLDNILSGAKQDPLIELVKTPGRKKGIAKKKTTSKLNTVITLSLDDAASEESTIPVNNFHKALLQAKDITSLVPLKQSDQTPFGQDENNYEISLTKIAHTSEMSDDILYDTTQVAPSDHNSTVVAPATLVPATLDQNELSVIAEDDETAERSRVSIQLAHGVKSQATFTEVLAAPSMDRNDSMLVPRVSSGDMRPSASRTSSSSADTFHSITLDSPQLPSRTSAIIVDVPSEECVISHTSQSSGNDYTIPLSEIPPWNPRNTDTSTSTTSTSATATQALDVPINGTNPASPTTLASQTDAPLFPILPAPMPLRKSMRVGRDPSTGMSLGAPTPGAVGGKRTSWLMKAREVKALETTGRKISALGTGVGSSSGGLANTKRKSGDIFTFPGSTNLDVDERKHKVAKNAEGDVAPLKAKEADLAKTEDIEVHATEPPHQHQHSSQHSQSHLPPLEEGMLDRFKRTVEGLGARVGKSMGKSLGAGAAATALAEARAAAEARVAERNHKEDEMTIGLGIPLNAPMHDAMAKTNELAYENAMASVPSPSLATPKELERRLSVSDLFTSSNRARKGIDRPESVGISIDRNRESTTTTPPDSPPTTQPVSFSFALPSGRVFNKPPPVFVPPESNKPLPVAASSKDLRFDLPPSTAFSKPVPMSLGLGARVHPTSPPSQYIKPYDLAPSTSEHTKSDALSDGKDAVAWKPISQADEYPSRSDDQAGPKPRINDLDEDDSWPLDEKVSSDIQWTFGTGMGKEDSMTWSTLRSESQRADTAPLQNDQRMEINNQDHTETDTAAPSDFDAEMDNDYEGDEELVVGDSELEDILLNHGKPTVSLMEPKTTRSNSQMSMASSSSSQSQGGFLNQASKLFNSALGTSKKGKPEVKKVLQMAAVAAKKQQEENDKKAARLKEMENRRQVAMQRKVEEEKTRADEQDRKLKEEGERRKREREEYTDKRPLKPAGSKKEEDINTKKRKVALESEKSDTKKPGPAAKSSLNTNKNNLKPVLKQPAALSSSAAYNASLQTIAASSSNPKLVESKPPKPTPASKGKGKAAVKPVVDDDDISQPSQIIQTQMAARAKAQLQAVKQTTEPLVPSESIELPDINSEYSDSEDEDRARTFDPPSWAQSPELRQALQIQSTINPDDIFGAIRPLRMEELFRTRTSRFRARTSSANWTGADRLTHEEEREYARRMGFR